MMLRNLLAAGAVLFGMAGMQAHAAPAASQAGLAVPSERTLGDVVQYRGRAWGGYGFRGYGGGWRGGRGAWPWVGLGAGIAAGAIILNQAYRPRVGYYYDTYAYDGPYYYPRGYEGDPRDICARHFKSFEWRTGMYTTYGGERRLCPYLQ